VRCSLGSGVLGCGITAVGGVALGEVLESNTTLTCLTLSGNALQDLGAFAFADVICYNRTLRRVSLDNARIGPHGGDILLLAVRLQVVWTMTYISHDSELQVEGGGNSMLQSLQLLGNDMPSSIPEDVNMVLGMNSEKRERRKRRVWQAKPVECRLGCGTEHLFKLQQFRHETRDCPCRVLPCPLGCGEQLMVGDWWSGVGGVKWGANLHYDDRSCHITGIWTRCVHTARLDALWDVELARCHGRRCTNTNGARVHCDW